MKSITSWAIKSKQPAGSQWSVNAPPNQQYPFDSAVNFDDDYHAFDYVINKNVLNQCLQTVWSQN